jgi:myo-inositol 2-dehydrogenase / D-chiro-inositol 1-dehydrogenase
MSTIKIGLIGAGYIGDIHAAALRTVPDAEVVAVASPTPGQAESFANGRGIPHAFLDYHDLLAMTEIDLVTVGVPTALHAQVAVDAATAGKHVICETPLCLALDDADRMIEASAKAGRLLMVGENLCFAPKIVRARQLIDEGGVGRVFRVRQSGEYAGPAAPWAWDVDLAGGGVLLDLGCHAIEAARTLLGKPAAQSVTAHLGTYVHGAKTRGEDHSLCVVEYAGGLVGVAENSWARAGGADDRCEITGAGGFTRTDLAQGSSLLTYSERGYGYSNEKAASLRGFTFTMVEELWTYGFPQEMAHFIRCAQGRESPMETGEDGREVLRIILAAYESAGTGRRIAMPHAPPAVGKPIDLWHPPA